MLDLQKKRPRFGDAFFERATFTSAGDEYWSFYRAQFDGVADFNHAHFEGAGSFGEAVFSDLYFFGATFDGHASFHQATFGERVRALGPLVCTDAVSFSWAVFEGPVEIMIVGSEVDCFATRWDSTVTLRLRYAALDLTGAKLSSSTAVQTQPYAFHVDEPVDEQAVADACPPGIPSTARLTSIRWVDAAHLLLTDVDLSECEFSGAFHLDQLRMEACKFAETPLSWRWTRRKVLAEEQRWRGWRPPPEQDLNNPLLRPGDSDVSASTYRQLRKSFEDAKNEPDAADFYYGEIEMRRHDRRRTWAERALLTLYWAVSGYGLRASRAFLALLFSMVLTVVLLMWVGLPVESRGLRTKGAVTAGQGVDVTTEASGPGGATPGPQRDRFTWERAKQASLTTINSVVFRSAGQDLTLPGTYVEMTSRVVEPALLALALLAVRGRVKR